MGRSLSQDLSKAPQAESRVQDKVNMLSSEGMESLKEKVGQLEEAEKKQKLVEKKIAELTEQMETFTQSSQTAKVENCTENIAELMRVLNESNATLKIVEEERAELEATVKRLSDQIAEGTDERRRHEAGMAELKAAEKRREDLEKMLADMEIENEKSRNSEATHEVSEEVRELEHKMTILQNETNVMQEKLAAVLTIRKKEEIARKTAQHKGVDPIEIIEEEAYNRTLHEFDECAKHVEVLEKMVDEQAYRIKTLEEFLVNTLKESPSMLLEAQHLMNQDRAQQEKRAVASHAKEQDVPKKDIQQVRQDNARALLCERFQQAKVEDLIPQAIDLALQGYAIETNTKKVLASAFHSLLDGDLDNFVQKARTSEMASGGP